MTGRLYRAASAVESMVRDDPGAAGIWAVPSVALLVLTVRVGGGFDGALAGLVALGKGALWLAGALAAWWLWSRLGGRGVAGQARGLVGHSHGAGRTLLRHEGGHVVGAKSMRAFDRAWVGSDSGYVRLQRSKVDKLTPAQYLAFCKVGELAAGTSAGCSGDRRNYRAEVGRMRSGGSSAAEIAKAQRIGDMMAARWAASPDVDRWADRLGERKRM